MIRSGRRAAIFSKLGPASPLFSTTSGRASPHLSFTQGHCVLMSGLWPAGFGYWSTMPTGLTPNARMVWSSV